MSTMSTEVFTNHPPGEPQLCIRFGSKIFEVTHIAPTPEAANSICAADHTTSVAIERPGMVILAKVKAS